MAKKKKSSMESAANQAATARYTAMLESIAGPQRTFIDEYNQQFAAPIPIPQAVEENVQIPGASKINVPIGPTTIVGPTTITGPTKIIGPTTITGPTLTPTTATAPVGTDPALLALLAQLSQQNLAAQLAAQAEADRRAAAAQAERQSAYDLLYQQFSQYGLGALVEPLKGFITSGINPSEFTIRLRETDAYKKRFAANAARIAKGLRALSEAEYIGLEDQYQDVMRRYGLPDTYYTRGEMGRQEGFEKFIAGDVSPVELEERLQIGQRRLINAPKEVLDALKQFYGNEITNGDALAYVVDTEKALENIKRKVTAAEIGAGAMQAGLATGVARAEELGRFGVTGEQARTGYQAIAGILPRGSQLAEFYKTGPYTQTTAEQEVFGIPGATEAAKQRQRLTQLEQAAFSGSSGATGGALARERAGSF